MEHVTTAEKKDKDEKYFSETLYEMFRPELLKIFEEEAPDEDELYRACEMIKLVQTEMKRECNGTFDLIRGMI